jgi:hypothetical protein
MTRKCEKCGKEIEINKPREHPEGWVATGWSRYGKKHDNRGIAWWCPECKVTEAWWRD